MESVSASQSPEYERLELWERAAGLDSLRRVEALLRAHGEPPSVLGARNAALLAIRSRLFGNAWSLRSDCPGCGGVTEFTVDSARLVREWPAIEWTATEHELDVEGHMLRFRLPCIEDLYDVASLTDIEDVAAELLRRCVLEHRPPGGTDSDALPEWVRSALSQRMEALDPGANVSFAITCPHCGHAWQAPVDVGGALWAELQAAAERTVLEVDALARAYGWSEPQILALSPTRRAAYLQLAGAG